MLLLMGMAFAQDVDLDAPDPEPTSVAPRGHRITGFGGSHGLGLSEQLVLGGDGGTSITTLDARIAAEDWTIRVALPFAAYRIPGRRDTDLGNLRLEALYAVAPVGAVEHALGLSAHANPGGTPWTWATRADEVWPGFGVDGVWEARSELEGGTTVLGRGSVGIHSTSGFAPIPSTWARLSGSAAVDQQLGQVAGVVGEVSASWWEVAPVEVTALMRVDPTDGLRVRGGLVLPVFTWFGWEPVGRPGGARETTLALDLQASF